ncbi:MAG: 3-phosphoshikimate 1-carboxyvinyltransferase [Euryarchaeota archaeon]|nr:3-phosphoshikimate 1-carboxyvinyltransferase [Euryarchaeota archaeon]
MSPRAAGPNTGRRIVVSRTRELSGTVRAPPSKSHTHRALAVACLARGRSTVHNALLSDDCLATAECFRRLGAVVEFGKAVRVTGVDGRPRAAPFGIDVGNSGTTLRFLTAVCALCDGETVIDGGGTIRRRPVGPLLRALSDLGARRAESVPGNGCPPAAVAGRLRGGRVPVYGFSSQFVSALLLALPLAPRDSVVEAMTLNSRPYVAMTMEHLERAGAGVRFEEPGTFRIDGGQSYWPSDYAVPGDHSSAAFLRAAAFITESDINITGLDPRDSQPDRAIGGIISQMGVGSTRELDLRDMPDLLPVAAALGCHAAGTTVLRNVRHSRAKESDRISAMCAELRKLRARITERPDGLVVTGSELAGARLDGHNDHRIVMALAVAALRAEGRTVIDGAETLSKSYPGFVDDLRALGARIRVVGK